MERCGRRVRSVVDEESNEESEALWTKSQTKSQKRCGRRVKRRVRSVVDEESNEESEALWGRRRYENNHSTLCPTFFN
ncbi:17206_t:CDS:2 [Gigaspora margarita]|uniref:17206_t:CDS:1 n=1 Tax=Gigaspora margarita TaxID=4874 RepID=A0ABM8VZB7_GIGMA|nr:17206_t:CDS:2 [Gigaspora margarita]